MSCVYALVAKSYPDEIRYVGKSRFDTPSQRRSQHIHEALKLGELTHKCNWVRKVLTEGDEVVAIILESGLTSEEAIRREIALIAHYHALGHKLTNATLGGEGVVGLIHSDETRERMRISHMGKEVSALSREKISIALTGRKHTEAAKEKMSVASTGNTYTRGHKRTEESKEKNRIGSLGNTNRLGTITTEETRNKIRAGVLKYHREKNTP